MTVSQCIIDRLLCLPLFFGNFVLVMLFDSSDSTIILKFRLHSFYSSVDSSSLRAALQKQGPESGESCLPFSTFRIVSEPIDGLSTI